MTKLIPLDAAIAEIEKWWKCQSAWQSPMTILRAIPAIDPAAIREAALREAADIASGHDYSLQSSTAADVRAQQIASAILALIGKANSMIGEKK